MDNIELQPELKLPAARSVSKSRLSELIDSPLPQQNKLPRAADAPVRLRTRLAYRLSRSVGKFVQFSCINAQVIRPQIPNRPGGYLLACTHLSHLEPLLFGLLTRRSIDWMTRIEFFRHRPIAHYLRSIGAFAVHRQGVPVSAIRTAIARARQGRVVGICPEGGVAIKRQSVCRGGRIKRGVCLVAARANVPIIPCVMLGTYNLNRVGPWLPFRPRVQIWAAFASPIWPDPNAPNRKVARADLARKLENEYVRLYQELLCQYGLDDADIP